MKSEHESEEEDEEEEPIGIMGFLRNRFSTSASGKPSAKAKAQASAKAPATKVKSSKSGNSKTAAKAPAPKASVSKTVIGETASSAKKRKASAMDADGSDDENPQTSEMSTADSTLLLSFQERMHQFNDLSPPVADGAFKQYFTEKTQAIASFAAELKTKKKSVSRRSNFEEDPFYIGLCQLDEQKQSLQTLIKCI